MAAMDLPPAARAIARTVTALAAAASAGDGEGLREACARLRECDETAVGDVLARLTLGLVERAFPDGLDADDIRSLFDEVARAASPWLAGLDPMAVLVVVAGTLGVHPPDDAPKPSLDRDALPIACALVVDHLLGRLGAPLAPELNRAFDELRTAQTMDIP